MALIRTATFPQRSRFMGQLGTSVAATVAATLIVSAIQHEMATLRPAIPSPELTTGGKFAARVSALRAAADDTEPSFVAPPSVPLMVADAALDVLPVQFATPAAAPAAKPIQDPAKPAKRTARSDVRHRSVADANVEVLPPKRSDSLESVAAAASPNHIQAASTSIWSTTKDFYKQAIWLGESAVDHVNPMNLLR